MCDHENHAWCFVEALAEVKKAAREGVAALPKK
jgi:hypothetical protein